MDQISDGMVALSLGTGKRDIYIYLRLSPDSFQADRRLSEFGRRRGQTDAQTKQVIRPILLESRDADKDCFRHTSWWPPTFRRRRGFGLRFPIVCLPSTLLRFHLHNVTSLYHQVRFTTSAALTSSAVRLHTNSAPYGQPAYSRWAETETSPEQLDDKRSVVSSATPLLASRTSRSSHINPPWCSAG